MVLALKMIFIYINVITLKSPFRKTYIPFDLTILLFWNVYLGNHWVCLKAVHWSTVCGSEELKISLVSMRGLVK